MDIDLRVNRNIPVPGQNPPRRLASEFPACACDCLRQVDRALRHGSHQKGAARNVRDLQNALDQDLFCFGQDKRSTRLTPIQELKLLDMLRSYFKEKAEMEESRQRYAYFELIFCGREGETLLHEARIALLVKLCSLAVQYRCDTLFVDIGIWLQKIGLERKPYAKQIVDRLCQDFCSPCTTEDHKFLLMPLHSHIHPLVTTAPEFAPFFLTLSLNDFQLYQPIPKPLLETAALWLSENPATFIRPFREVDKTPNLVPLNRLFSNEVFPKLISLVCVGPLMAFEDEYNELLTQLHLGHLHLMMNLSETETPHNVWLVKAEVIIEIMNKIITLAQTDQSCVNLSLDRLAQIFQVAIASKCFYGFKENIRLKYNQLNLKHELFDFIFAS